MGYYVDITDCNFSIKVEHYPTIIERWLEFEKDEASYYTSIFNRSDDQLPMLDDVAQLFRTIGFEVSENDQVLTIESFDGKSWLEGNYIQAIGDLAEPGWYIDWHGEDDEHWRQAAYGNSAGEHVYIEPSLQSRLADLTTMLDEYEATRIPQNDAVIAEVQATGPIIDAVRALIKDLS